MVIEWSFDSAPGQDTRSHRALKLLRRAFGLSRAFMASPGRRCFCADGRGAAAAARAAQRTVASVGVRGWDSLQVCAEHRARALLRAGHPSGKPRLRFDRVPLSSHARCTVTASGSLLVARQVISGRVVCMPKPSFSGGFDLGEFAPLSE